MKTIEERAEKYALDVHPYEPFFSTWREAYIEIATEQRAIDIEKAWSILKGLIDDSAYDGYCEKHIITQAQFREAMEE